MTEHKVTRKIPCDKGMLYYIVEKTRPKLAEYIKKTGKIETAVIGLGKQGTKHAGLMSEYGTFVAAGVAAGRGGTFVHETIPVYNTIKECVKENPNLCAVSIWRHYSKAKDSAIEAIESGIPIVVLITEWLPLKDVRDIICKAKEYNAMLIGGNTPGIIFPPEGIKVGMLPDVFYPEEKSEGVFGPAGVTILSRSGAILYHMSDALASNGISQNAVIGVGGDGAIGSTFSDLVPIVSSYEHTDLVVVAGEIGGCQEEKLAEDVKNNPKKYPKPIVALISGSRAPAGKTMGHAGAIVAPGQEYGTFESKKRALEDAGITVVNCQFDLIEAVKKELKGKKYFDVDRYYEAMSKKWDTPPAKPSWGTLITKIEPNNIMIYGYLLTDLIKKCSFLDTVHLLITGKLGEVKITEKLNAIAIKAAKTEFFDVKLEKGEDISKYISKCFLLDNEILKLPQKSKQEKLEKTVFALGRVIRYLAAAFDYKHILDKLNISEPFSFAIFRALTGKEDVDKNFALMLEKMVLASVDHGVTPPSAQATLIASSVRSSYEVAVASGVSAITDVHGGAGAAAAEFFRECVKKSEDSKLDKKTAVHMMMEEYISKGKRIKGLGHRVHTKDPRRDDLWLIAEKSNISSSCVEISKFAGEIFKNIRGMNLPINVDGVIGAIVADMGLPSHVAKAIFVYGRIAGLSAHYFEEIAAQPEMRRINFSEAVYKGPLKKTI